MDLSVVIPALNDRDRLVRTLDALTERAPAAEIVVVNGPSVDGTSGTIRDRADVDVLVEVDARGVNVARNAGIARARGDVVALLGPGLVVEEGWAPALRNAFAEGPPAAATGPSRRSLRAGRTADQVEHAEVGGRRVTQVNGRNVAFTCEALEAIDGFDEYLVTGGARDAADRLAARDREVAWVPEMGACREVAADGGDSRWPVPPADGRTDHEVAWPYRALAYRLTKNYGVGTASLSGVLRRTFADGRTALAEVFRGESGLGRWVGDGRCVLRGTAAGLRDGTLARLRDRAGHNPNGLSGRGDRAVAVYDRR